MWKWFSRTDEGFEPVECTADETDIDTESADTLPAHVQEFLAQKAAAGF